MDYAHRHRFTTRARIDERDLQPGQMAVKYDGTADVYDVDADERDDFITWAACTWATLYPNSEQQFDDTVDRLDPDETVIDFGA